MTVIDAKYTLPNINPSAIHRVKGKGGRASQRWYVVWLHVWTTSGLTEQEANEAELNNYLQAQECAIFTGYSSIIIHNISLFLIFFNLCSVQYTTCKMFETFWNKQFVVLFYNFIHSVFNIKPFGWLVLLNVCHLISDNKLLYFTNHS